MCYFFELEDYSNVNCTERGDSYLKQMEKDALTFRNDYYLKNKTYEGYLPKQRIIVLAPNGEIKVFASLRGKISKSENEGFGSFCCENTVPLLMSSRFSENNLPFFPNLETSTIYWDNNTQACRWKKPSIEDGNFDPFKIAINPSGNDGTVFKVGKDDDCTLNIEFDFLFKYDCKDLTDTLETTNAITTSNVNVKLINDLKERIVKTKIECETITNKIQSTTKEYNTSRHSINCDNFPISRTIDDFEENWYERPQRQRFRLDDFNENKAWGRTAFNTLTAPFSYSINSNSFYSPVSPTKQVSFCINEPDGLNEWKTILGNTRFDRFINGDALSYNCNDVKALSNLNDIRLRKGESALVYACNTPFGFKSSLNDNINKLTEDKKVCTLRVMELEDELQSIVTTESTETELKSICSSPAQVLETLDVSFTIDIIENNGTHTTVLEQPLHEAIGLGNLYDYLIQRPTDSGFYVNGKPNQEEINNYYTINDGVVLKYNDDELYGPAAPIIMNCWDGDFPEGYWCNVLTCRTAKDILLKNLFDASNLDNSQLNSFKSSLSKNIFASTWLNKSIEITDIDILDRIKNKKITITLKVNNSCSNVCVLMDNIKINSNCTNTIENIITLSSSPGFVLEKYVDNKKSWINNTSNVNRRFNVSDNKGDNSIRQTKYDVNDERLVINTKEIDLDVDISNAIQFDVWKYVLDNPCLLTGTTYGTLCFSGCGDNGIISYSNLLTEDLINVDTVNEFEENLTSELIDVKNRKTLSAYPTLRGLYERYLNNTNCDNISSKFTYQTMGSFSDVIGTYWVDLVEQVVPSTTIWGSSIILGNTIFDQQKFQYKKGTLETSVELYDGNTLSNKFTASRQTWDWVNDCITEQINTFYLGCNITEKTTNKNLSITTWGQLDFLDDINNMPTCEQLSSWGATDGCNYTSLSTAQGSNALANSFEDDMADYRDAISQYRKDEVEYNLMVDSGRCDELAPYIPIAPEILTNSTFPSKFFYLGKPTKVNWYRPRKARTMEGWTANTYPPSGMTLGQIFSAHTDDFRYVKSHYQLESLTAITGNAGDVSLVTSPHQEYAWDPVLLEWNPTLSDFIDGEIMTERREMRNAHLKAKNELILAMRPFTWSNYHLLLHPIKKWFLTNAPYVTGQQIIDSNGSLLPDCYTVTATTCTVSNYCGTDRQINNTQC